jgi:hypothetical protein
LEEVKLINTPTRRSTLLFLLRKRTSRVGLPHYREFTITQAHHTQQDSSGEQINPTQNPLPDKTQHSKTDIHAFGGIRTHNPSKRAAAELRFRPRSQWDRFVGLLQTYNDER